MYILLLKTMCQELDGEEGAVQSLLTRGQDLLDESLAEHVMLITEKLNQLKDRWQDAREYAVRQQVTACLLTAPVGETVVMWRSV